MSDLNGRSGEPQQGTQEWFERWFASELYMELYSHRDTDEAERCIELIIEATGLDPAFGAVRVLDVASGPGRHAIALARRGFIVTGVDLSPTLLRHSRNEAAEADVEIEFIESDMRDIDFTARFDLVVQLFTSFGYFSDPADDLRVLERVRRALHPGGWYALDLINEHQLRSNLVRSNQRVVNGLTITEERWIDRDRVNKRITVPGSNGPDVFTESVRLFGAIDIERLLHQARLTPVHWFGGYDGEPYDEFSSQRMLILSRAD